MEMWMYCMYWWTLLLSWTETTLNSRSLTCKSHTHSHVCFVKGFLYSHALSFIEHLDLEWLLLETWNRNDCCLESFSKLYYVLNMWTMNSLVIDSLSSIWVKFLFSCICGFTSRFGLLQCLPHLQSPLGNMGPQAFSHQSDTVRQG